MPQFAGGELRGAIITLSNPTTKNLIYNVDLIIGLPEVARGTGAVSVAAGATDQLYITLNMPTTPGTYPVFLAISSDGVLVSTHRATEDISILQAGNFTFGTPEGIMKSPTGIGSGWSLAEIRCLVTNTGASPVTRQLKVLYEITAAPGWRDERVWEYTPTDIYSLAASPKTKTLTLNPGESVTLIQPHEFIDSRVNPAVYGSLWNQPAFGTPSAFRFKLVDDLGNESPVIVMQKY